MTEPLDEKIFGPVFPTGTACLGQGDLGDTRNTCSLSAFITARHTEDVAPPHASHSFSPPILMTSLLGLFKLPGSSAGRDVSLCSLQRKLPPILPVPLQTHCLCSQPSFPSSSIVSCSLCSSLSNNSLFIFTLMRVLLLFFSPYVLLQMHNNFLLPCSCLLCACL